MNNHRIVPAVAWLVTMLSAFGAPRPAVAQTQPAVDDATREQARDLFRRGRQLYQDDRSEEALDLLRQSYELMPSWATSNGMALCEEKLGHAADALRLYERSLQEGGAVIPDTQRAQLDQRIQELRRSLNLTRLSVVTSPVGAQILFDGSALGTTPFEGNVASGEHTLSTRLDGYETAERSVTLGAGESRTVDVTLVARAQTVPVPGAERGLLAVSGDETGWAVYVDGSQLGTTPLPPTEVPLGERLVRVEAGDRVWEERVQVSGQQTTRVSLTLGGGVPQGWFWGVAATAAAAGIGFAATGGYAWSLHNDWEGATGAERADLADSGNLMLDVADALLGVAGGAAIAALVLAFFTDFGGAPEAAISVEGAGQGESNATAATGTLVW